MASVLAPTTLTAQAGTLPLGPPTPFTQQQFTQVVAVRELSDGRTLISDRRENVLYIAR